MRIGTLMAAIALAGCTSVGEATSQPAETGSGETPQPSETLAAVPEVWQGASPEEADQILNYILQSPLGIAALNQLAIEGFISPTCDRTFYTHTEYDTFQTLLQVECDSPRGASGARAYDEMRVTFNRFEDTISDFSVERINSETANSGNNSAGRPLPDNVAQAVLETAAQQAGVDPEALQVVESESRTWPDSCLGLGGPDEACAAVLTEGWRVVVAMGDRQWVFRTNAEGSQVRLASDNAT